MGDLPEKIETEAKVKPDHRRKSSHWKGDGLRKRSLAKVATIVPTEDKFQKLKNVRLAGFSFVARTTNWYARIFWILLILFAFSFCIYEVYRTIADFINNPVITTYVLRPLEEIEMPSLFVCPSTIISGAFFNSEPAKTSAILNMMKALKAVGTKDSFDSHGLDMVGAAGNWRMTGKEFEDNFMRMGFEVDQIFLSCQFYANSSEWQTIDCSEIVTPIVDHRFGKCFHVLLGRNQTTEGKALAMIINSRSKSDAVNDSLILKPYEGLYVTVGSGYQPMSNDQNLVSAGLYTKMALGLTITELLNLPKGAIIQPCLEDPGESLKILNTSYTISSCRFECSLSEIIRICNCLPLLDKSTFKSELLKSAHFCGFDDYKRCISANVSVSDNSKKNIGDCKASCLPACKSQKYEISSSGAPLNPVAFEKYSTNGDVDELIFLEIAFNRIEQAEFKQSSSMTFDFFVGNMGSQITLWLGGCMLTLVPLPLSLLAFCVMAGFLKVKKLCKRKGDD